jgi:hypothetical protein
MRILNQKFNFWRVLRFLDGLMDPLLSEWKVSVNELDKKNDFGVLRVEGK